MALYLSNSRPCTPGVDPLIPFGRAFLNRPRVEHGCTFLFLLLRSRFSVMSHASGSCGGGQGWNLQYRGPSHQFTNGAYPPPPPMGPPQPPPPPQQSAVVSVPSYIFYEAVRYSKPIGACSSSCESEDRNKIIQALRDTDRTGLTYRYVVYPQSLYQRVFWLTQKRKTSVGRSPWRKSSTRPAEVECSSVVRSINTVRVLAP